MRRSLRSWVVAIAWSLAPVVVLAQTGGDASIVGTVTDTTGAVVPGATVTVSGANLIGGPRRLTTDRVGAYRVSDLTSGTYQIVVALDGFRTNTRFGVRLPAGWTLTVDVELQPAGVAEQVHVTATAPLVDVRSAAAPVLVDRDLLQNVPTNRTVADLMNLAPGVNGSIGLGGTQQSNPVYIDGVNVSDAQMASPFSVFNYNWIDETQIVSLGANAEYGDFSGVVQRSTLKSGSNRFSGLTELRTTRPSWVGANTSSLPVPVQTNFTNQSTRLLAWHDASVQAGGPLVKDRLWFFTGLQDFTNNAKPALVAGPGSADERDQRVLLKMDSAPRAAMRLDGYYENDRYHLGGSGLDPFDPIETTTTDSQPDHNWNARARWTVGGSTALELSNSGYTGVLSMDPTAPATRSAPYSHYDMTTGMASLNTTYYFDYGSGRNTTALTGSRYMDGFGGRHHALKFGSELERATSTWVTGYPGGRLYLDDDGLPSMVELQDESRSRAIMHRVTMYAQDEWAVGERVTIQPGIRVTLNRGIVSQGTVFRTNPVDPRIGVAWDTGRDHRTVVRLHFGRYHEAMLTANFSLVDAAGKPPLTTALVTGPGPNDFVPISVDTSTDHFGLDPNISQAYFDQYVAGMERQLSADWVMTVQYVGRGYRNLMAFIDTGSIYQPIERQDPGPDGTLGTADDGQMMTVYRKTNPGLELYELTNPLGATRRYDALQLIARKQLSRNWQLQASYAWSSTRGVVANTFRSNSDGPETGYNGVFADPNRAINAGGPSPFDFTHEVKVLGTWRLPLWGGVNVSGVYAYHTGFAWGRTVRFPGTPFNINPVRIEVRGTRRTDALDNIDLRVEKTLSLRRAGKIGVFADVFNLTNQGAPDPAKTRAVVDVSGTTFGQPTMWLAPRVLRVGVRLTF